MSTPRLTTGEYRRGEIEDVIATAVEARASAFGLADALELPSVVRGRQLLTSTAALMVPQLIRDQVAAADQPRIVRRPDPYTTRQAFIASSVAGLVDHGEVFWRIGERDQDGFARFAVVLHRDEVRVEWDARRWQRRYHWRDQELTHGVDVLHIALDMGPAELHGHGPLSPDRGLPSLQTVYQAELYASTFYGGGGVPNTVLVTAAKLTGDEAEALGAQWAAARARGQLTGRPAIASGGISPTFPGVDPERSQLQATRDFGNTVVARLLGIPAPLLHVATSGATITYQNAQGAVDELVKATIVPMYLSVIEAHWSDLVPRSSAVRFALGELVRADIVTRWNVYTQAIGAGAMSAAEARELEGWGQAVNAAAMLPSPAVTAGDTAPPMEVPTI